jgi:uncharacterized protein (TIGR00106 family)
MALMEISVVPIGTGSTSVGDYVVEMQRLLSKSGLRHQLTDMGTTVEGDLDQLLTVTKSLHESPYSLGAQRVYTVIKIDDRRDREVHLGEKTGSVLERL